MDQLQSQDRLIRQQGLQASGLGEGQPGTDGVPMHGQQVGESQTGSRLPTGEQVQGLQPLASLGVVLRSQLFL
jgi:hypothetical protein